MRHGVEAPIRRLSWSFRTVRWQPAHSQPLAGSREGWEANLWTDYFGHGAEAPKHGAAGDGRVGTQSAFHLLGCPSASLGRPEVAHAKPSAKTRG